MPAVKKSVVIARAKNDTNSASTTSSTTKPSDNKKFIFFGKKKVSPLPTITTEEPRLPPTNLTPLSTPRGGGNEVKRSSKINTGLATRNHTTS